MDQENAAVQEPAAGSRKKKASPPAKGRKAASAASAKASDKATGKSKPKKEKKPKVIRDSFTLPAEDYAKLAGLKQACLNDGLHVKKSELVRAGLRLLSRLDSDQLRAEMAAVEKIKTGRPKAK